MSKKTKTMAIIIIPLGVLAIALLIFFAFIFPNIKDNNKTLVEEGVKPEAVAGSDDEKLTPLYNEAEFSSEEVEKKIDYSEYREIMHKQVEEAHYGKEATALSHEEIDVYMDFIEKYGIEMNLDGLDQSVFPIDLAYLMKNGSGDAYDEYIRINNEMNAKWDAYRKPLEAEMGAPEDPEEIAYEEWKATQHEEFLLGDMLNRQSDDFRNAHKELPDGKYDPIMLGCEDVDKYVAQTFPTALGTYDYAFVPNSFKKNNDMYSWKYVIYGLNDGEDVEITWAYQPALGYLELHSKYD